MAYQDTIIQKFHQNPRWSGVKLCRLVMELTIHIVGDSNLTFEEDHKYPPHIHFCVKKDDNSSSNEQIRIFSENAKPFVIGHFTLSS